MTLRIGVVTDTHVPEFLPELPPGVIDGLRGVDLVFHCGDVTGTNVLDDLARIAPVHAVNGNHDSPALGLPERRVVEAGGVRFGLVHGYRDSVLDNYLVAGTNVLWWRWLFVSPGYIDFLTGGFDEPVDYVVCGHVHRPLRARRNGVEIFSPGAVYMPTRKLLRWARARGWRPDRRDWVQQILQRVPTPIPPPAIGLIHVDDAGVRAERVELPEFR